MRPRSTALRAAVLVLSLGTLLAGQAGPAQASHSRYQQLQRDIDETREKIRDARRRESRLLNQIAVSDERRDRLEATISRFNHLLVYSLGKLENLEARLNVATARMQLQTQRLQLALADLEDRAAQVSARAAGIYMNSTETYTTVLLGQNDYRDFVAGVEYARRVFGRDLGLLEEIESKKNQISFERDSLERERAGLQRAQEAIRKEAKRMADLKSQQARARNAVQSEISYRERLLSQVRDEKDAYIQALNSMLAESQSIESMLRGAQSGQRVVAGAGRGYLVWPTSGQVTSPYGWRTHPVYGYRSFHTGIDIGAPQGQGVIAARGGEVLYTGYRGAYGLIAIVDHGNALATVYSHLSRVYVRPGQAVSARSLIAAVGSTGWSTGPHLHFEVRINGEHTNPTRYL